MTNPRASLDSAIKMVAETLGITPKQLRDEGLYDFLNSDAVGTPREIARRCLSLAVGGDDYWSPAAPAFILGAAGFMALNDFPRLTDAQMIRLKDEILSRNPADIDALRAWFDIIYAP